MAIADADGVSRLPNQPSLIEKQFGAVWLRFLIMDAPSDSNIELYVRAMKKFHVTDVVRVCDPTYARDTLDRNGIRLWVRVRARIRGRRMHATVLVCRLEDAEP